MPAALPVDWPAVMLACVAGCRYESLAMRYGISAGTIRKRAEREKWPIPARVRRSAAKTYKAALIAEHGNADSIPATQTIGNTDVTLPKSVAKGVVTSDSVANAVVTVTDDLQEIGQSGTLRAAQVALRSLQRAPDALAIASPSDLKTAMQVVRIAAGMDSGDGPRIAIGLFGGGASATSRMVVDAGESEPVDCDLASE